MAAYGQVDFSMFVRLVRFTEVARAEDPRRGTCQGVPGIHIDRDGAALQEQLQHLVFAQGLRSHKAPATRRRRALRARQGDQVHTATSFGIFCSAVRQETDHRRLHRGWSTTAALAAQAFGRALRHLLEQQQQCKRTATQTYRPEAVTVMTTAIVDAWGNTADG